MAALSPLTFQLARQHLARHGLAKGRYCTNQPYLSTPFDLNDYGAGCTIGTVAIVHGARTPQLEAEIQDLWHEWRRSLGSAGTTYTVISWNDGPATQAAVDTFYRWAQRELERQRKRAMIDTAAL